jgi:predicted ATPase/class 3 adenylate cyclase
MALPTGPAVTFLFTDIEGSTRLERAVGADAWAAVVAEHDRRLRAAIEGEGGHVVKTEGDAVFAAFDSARGALAAVVAGQRALAAEPLVPTDPVRVRAGLHLGVGRVRTDLAPGAPPDYVGIDVNYAARIAAAANGGQIVLSEPLVKAVGVDVPAQPGVRLVDEGLRIVKDFEEPSRLFRLVVDGAADDERPLRTLDAPSNLPHATTTLIGREAEIERLATAVAEHRIVTLAGPGGSGKTRLALGVADHVRGHFPHGTWFVDLADVSDPTQFEPAIATTIGIRTPPGGNVAETLAAWLQERQVLLVLDNLEQLLPAAADATARLVRSALGLRVLVTSRELLRIGGEQGNQVQPLDVDAGAALFEDRARLHRPDLVIDEAMRATILQIAERLDGLPLAIELAAARIRVMSPAAILERLGRTLDLGGGARDLPARQRTLRGAIDWSHELLIEPERRLFRRLAVFAGGWDGEEALAVADADGGVGGDVLALLESLLDKSLIRLDREPVADSGGDGRFAMHVLIREYASERLDEAGEREAVEERHARTTRDVAERFGAQLQTASGEAAMRRLDREQHNIRAAVVWSVRTGELGTGLGIMAAIWRWFQQRGRPIEGRELLADLLNRPTPEALVRERIGGLSADGGLAYWTADFEGARARYEECLALADRTADAMLIADAHYDLGFVFMVAEDAPRLRAHEEKAYEIYSQLGEASGIERARQALVLVRFLENDYETARRLTEENIAAYRQMGAFSLVADSLTLLSAIGWQLGQTRVAWDQLREGLRIFADRDLASGLARALGMAAIVQLRFGDAELGGRIAGTTAELARTKGLMIAGAKVLHLPEPVAYAKQILGEERAEQLLAEGAATPVQQMAKMVLATETPSGVDRLATADRHTAPPLLAEQ